MLDTSTTYILPSVHTLDGTHDPHMLTFLILGPLAIVEIAILSTNPAPTTVSRDFICHQK